MKKLLTTACAVLMVLLTVAGCRQKQEAPAQEAPPLTEERILELHDLSVKLTGFLNSGNIEAATAMMDETMKKAMDGKLADTWPQLTGSAGVFIETGGYTGMVSGEYEVLEMTLVFENAPLIQRVVFTGDNLISGLFFRNGEIEADSESALPGGITEIDVTVDAGDGYPLGGKLTLPKDGKPSAAVVLIHGSGPSSMDEAIGANAPFRDLAYGLAESGIAVLRYDKRTYTHVAAMSESAAGITVNEETALDVLAAVELLKVRDEIDESNIYLLGHSFGGGLLSYINSLGADAAGYIVMAGTPRKLWELSAEQNLLVADELEQGGDNRTAGEIRKFVSQERMKAAGMLMLGSEETVFGMPAPYLQKLESIDTAKLHLDDKLPVLILQGENDRQVTMTDFSLWRELLAGHPDATFISYPELNHLFGEYDGDTVPFSQLVAVEYAQKTPVSQKVMDDITSWLSSHSRPGK